jgi:ribosomal protein S18 acetylase RimI-like enzyme
MRISIVKFPMNPEIRTLLQDFVAKHSDGCVTSGQKHLNPIYNNNNNIKIIVITSGSDGKTIVAIGGFVIVDKYVSNSWTITHKEHRGKGYGSKILDVKLSVAKMNGVKTFMSTTALENKSSMSLLKRHNFFEISHFNGSRRKMSRLIHLMEGIDNHKLKPFKFESGLNI